MKPGDIWKKGDIWLNASGRQVRSPAERQARAQTGGGMIRRFIRRIVREEVAAAIARRDRNAAQWFRLESDLGKANPDA